MALRLYRRHRKGCEAGHPEDFKSGEFEEGRRGRKRCACPIHASGTIRGDFKRQSTGQWEWDASRVIVAQWESTETWCELPLLEAVEPYQQATAQPAASTIPEATEAFLSKRETRGIRRTTLAKYRTFTNQLNAYAANRGYIRVDQLSVLDMDRFYASWTDAIRSRAKKLERLKSFIQFCKKRNCLTEDIAEDLDAPHGASVTMPKAPFSDEELQRIYAACDRIGAPTKPGPGHTTDTPATKILTSPTTTELTSSTATPAAGSPLIFTAKVSSAAGTPTGKTRPSTTAQSRWAQSRPTMARPSTAPAVSSDGTHSISAVYLGTARFLTSTSNTLLETVWLGRSLYQRDSSV